MEAQRSVVQGRSSLEITSIDFCAAMNEQIGNEIGPRLRSAVKRGRTLGVAKIGIDAIIQKL